MNEPILELKNISFHANGIGVLKDVNLRLESGETLTVSGPSGGGKTTLLKVMAGLLTPENGTVYLEGKPIGEYKMTTYRQEVSYAVQSAQLFGETVADNLNLPFEVRGVDVDVPAQIAGLKKMNLDETYLSRPISELSGGQKQRVGLLRNLLFPPKVLLLDEISTGLDEKTKQDIWSYIKLEQQMNGFAVVSVTHDTEEISQAIKQITVSEGQVQDNG